MSALTLISNQSLLENSKDAFLAVGSDWAITYANRSAAALLHRDPASLVGKPIWAAWPEIPETPFEEAFRRVAKSGIAETFEGRYPVEDVWLEGQAVPIEGGLGIFFRDISDRKRREDKLRDQSELLELAFDAIIVHHNGGEVLFWNRSAERKYGWTRQEAIGQNIHALLKTESDDRIDSIYRVVEAKGNWEGELVHTTKDGQRKVISSRWVLRHHIGMPDSILEVNRDITTRVEAELALRSSEERYRSLMLATHDAVWGTDREGHTVEAQPLWEKYTGQTFEEYSSDGGFGAVHPDDRQRLAEAFGEAMERQDVFQHEYRLWNARHQDYRHVITKGIPVRNADGSIREWVGTILDVEDQRRAESELRAAEQRARVVMKSARINVYHQNLDRRYTRVDNPLGPIAVNQIIGHTIDEFMPGTYADELSRIETEVLASGQGTTRELCAQFPDGDLFIRLALEPFRNADGTIIGLTGATIDITDLKRAENELRASEERYRFLAEATPQLVWTAGPDGTVDYVNERWLRYFSVSLEQARSSEWAVVQHPDDLARVEVEWNRCVTEGADFMVEYRLRRWDGEYRWHLCRATAMRQEDGTIVRWFGTITDIQALKEAEAMVRESNERLEAAVATRTAELEAANRELEGFTYSVSHDLRGPLRAIGALGRILVEDYGPHLPAEAMSILNRQGAAATKLGVLIEELLQLSRIRRQSLFIQRFDISAAAREIAGELCERTWRGAISFDIEEGLEAEADPRLIHFVLLNLLENACKFSPMGGTVTFGSKDGAFFVRDQGIGLDTQYEEKLWRPFERLVRDSEFPGTGIGLTNVHRIVERHNGRIWVESEPGHGATFRFVL